MYLVLNHKMFLNPNDMLKYCKDLNNINPKNTKLIVCPSYIFIPYFKGKNYILGAQDVSGMTNGSFTGEVSSNYLKAFDVKYSLVNHFERKLYFHQEKKESIDKINNLQKYDIVPILCITTENYKDYEEIKKEIDVIYSSIDKNKKIILAYESEKAIREGKIENYDDLKETITYIKSYIKDNFNKDEEVIYGGSVNKETIKELLSLNCLDGFLMGKNSIYIDKIIEVITEVENG